MVWILTTSSDIVRPTWRFFLYKQWNMNLEHLCCCYIWGISISSLFMGPVSNEFFPCKFLWRLCTGIDYIILKTQVHISAQCVTRFKKYSFLSAKAVYESQISVFLLMGREWWGHCGWMDGYFDLAALHDSSLWSLPLSFRPMPWTLTLAQGLLVEEITPHLKVPGAFVILERAVVHFVGQTRLASIVTTP